VVVEQGRERCTVLLQRGDLRVHDATRLGKGTPFGGHGWLNGGNGKGRLLGESVELAMMQVGEPFTVFPADALCATIAGMVVSRKASVLHPAVEGCGVDAETATGIGNRDHGHERAPFTNRRTHEPTEQEENSKEHSQEHSRHRRTLILGTDAPERLPPVAEPAFSRRRRWEEPAHDWWARRTWDH
jgi:hypothetical protein